MKEANIFSFVFLLVICSTAPSIKMIRPIKVISNETISTDETANKWSRGDEKRTEHQPKTIVISLSQKLRIFSFEIAVDVNAQFMRITLLSTMR